MQIKCIWEPSILGEGPLWHPEEQALYWVDIVKPAVHRLEPRTGKHQYWWMPGEIGSIGFRAKGGLVAALRQAFVTIDLSSGHIAILDVPLTNLEGISFNDGKCDRQGRFWAGSKESLETNPVAGLYCLGIDGKSKLMAEHFTVTNGIGWSPDNTCLYVCDSPARIIYQYDFDALTGAIKHQRIFARIKSDAGYPDGLTVDSEGYVWSAHWDGWRVTRYTPAGQIDRVIEMPVQRPTSCCFGGPDLDILYVTSARVRLSEAEIAKGPLAGSLFAIDVGVRGLPEPAFLG